MPADDGRGENSRNTMIHTTLGFYQKAINADITDGAMDTYLVPDGFTLVKAEALADPTEMMSSHRIERT